MAGRDNVLFKASVASGTAAGTVIPFSILYGVENVRTGYGTPVLKSARAYYVGCYGSGVNNIGIPVDIKNSNWVDSAGVIAQRVDADTALNRDSLSFMRGRDKVLQPNTGWTMNATLAETTTAAGDIYLLLEIEYSGVEGINTEKAAGSPVYKKCANASVTGAANVPINIGTFDNLLQNVAYVMSEVTVINPTTSGVMLFVIVEGFSNQKGLIRMFPVKSTGLADQIEGSVTLTKQTYNVSILRSAAISATPVTIGFELIASAN